eukprot:scaffold9085_cov215-Amphora_coffeaeformis.AAC.23
MVVFECPIGAVADVKELEYVSALHQTAAVVRRDGSIDAADIKVFLRSRFGIEVTHREVCDTILQGMGGGNDDEQVLDLMEVVAILLIPVLRKAAASSATSQSQTSTIHNNMPPENLIQSVLEMILFDVLNEQQQERKNSTTDRQAPELTVQLLEKIFQAYGEEELAADQDLLIDMIQHATNETKINHDDDDDDDDESNKSTQESTSFSSGKLLILDVKTFATALTKDVLLFDINNETRPSNAYMDVFDDEKQTTIMQHEQERSSTSDPDNTTTTFPTLATPSPVRHIYTAPAIDSTAGTYRSKTLLISLWAGTLFTYFAFVRPTLPSTGDAECGAYVSTNKNTYNALLVCAYLPACLPSYVGALFDYAMCF